MPSGRAKKANTSTKTASGGATTGYEAELCAMADVLRGTMDAAEYEQFP